MWRKLSNLVQPWSVWLVALAAVFASAIGSAFNIWYNLIHVEPLLSDAQHDLFQIGILVNNAIVYPITTVIILRILYSVNAPFQKLRRGVSAQELDPGKLERARRRTINLPFIIMIIGFLAWFSVVPGLVSSVYLGDEPVNPWFVIHLTISVMIAAMIAVTHALFLTELIAQWWIYPVMFADYSPTQVKGAVSLSIRRRGMMWALSAGACPILTLLLLDTATTELTTEMLAFRWAVGLLGIVFGMGSAVLLSRLITHPVSVLQDAAQRIGRGDLSVQIEEKRSDEFGSLIDSFNAMVKEMRAKKQLQQVFGLHVGEQAAKAILAEGGLGGKEKKITVMFCDIRSFTERCGACSPEEAVALLNLFLTRMVDVVEEEHGGLVNKFLGDGFMAIFGAADERKNPAADAVRAGIGILTALKDVNAEIVKRGAAPFAIGVGIHSGPAVVGNIGSDRRREYTAIGDTVNIASRVEGLTKVVGHSLLLSAMTVELVQDQFQIESVGSYDVKGAAGVQIYYVK